MSSKSHLEEDDDLTSAIEKKSTAALEKSHPAAESYSNFDGNASLIAVGTLEPQ